MMPESSRSLFIVFEGLDGSGKTTVANLTAKALGADLMTTPSPKLRGLREEIIDAYADSQEAAQLFYLSTVFAASREIERYLAAGRSVVLDRYFLSTQAYAELRGSELRLDGLAELLLPADLTVFLDAPLATRRKRIEARGHPSAADRETLHPEADARLRSLHLAKSALPMVGRFLPIDSSRAPETVVEEVMTALRDRWLEASLREA